MGTLATGSDSRLEPPPETNASSRSSSPQRPRAREDLRGGVLAGLVGDRMSGLDTRM